MQVIQARKSRRTKTDAKNTEKNNPNISVIRVNVNRLESYFLKSFPKGKPEAQIASPMNVKNYLRKSNIDFIQMPDF